MGKQRGYTAACGPDRCSADITLKDGSGAQCMRPKRVGEYCHQHALMRLQDAIHTIGCMADDGIGADETGYREATANDCVEVLNEALGLPAEVAMIAARSHTTKG